MREARPSPSHHLLRNGRLWWITFTVRLADEVVAHLHEEVARTLVVTQCLRVVAQALGDLKGPFRAGPRRKQVRPL